MKKALAGGAANNEGVVFFQTPGTVVAPLSAARRSPTMSVSIRRRAGLGGVTLAYNARSREEVDEVLAEAEAAGATIAKAATEAFWGGYSGYFADPDGHLWEVAFNPFWTIADDGRVILGS